MIYRPYGATGVEVSILGFGGMRFGAIDDREACVAMMVQAAEAGITYFDTAPGYFGGKSETVFGQGFREIAHRGLPERDQDLQVHGESHPRGNRGAAQTPRAFRH
jgi:aryl-alcohol dehydrogenase-like predicted oxidoreductase